MKISVIISVYRSEKPAYFDRALQSIWTDQTHKPEEIVLVQDGPIPDDLTAVIEKWKKETNGALLLLKNELNIGLTKSLNKAIQQASGDLLARMDSDDISDKQRFERQLAFMESHPDVDILGGSLQEFNEENSCLNVRHYPLNNEQALKTMFKVSPLAHPSVMMRKRIFDEGIRYDERYRTSQDIALWYDAECKGYKIANIPEVALYFRRDGDVYKRRSKAKAWNEFKIYMNGIRRIYGPFTYKYAYAIGRLCFRMMPISIVKWGYKSALRKKVAESNIKN